MSVCKQMCKQIRGFKGILESELKRIKVRILSEQIYKRDSIFGQALENYSGTRLAIQSLNGWFRTGGCSCCLSLR